MKSLVKKEISISAFFPALNEEDNIKHVIDNAVSVLKRITKKYEIIIVLYEGSTDHTGEIVRSIAEKNQKVNLVIQPLRESGYGVALQIGYRNAHYEYVFYSDADRQFDLNQLEKYFILIEHFDLVVGYRRKRQYPLMRIIVSKVYNWIMRIVFDLEQRDVDCAFKLCRKSIFEKLSLKCKTGVADTELLVKARLNNCSIVEVGVDHFPRIAGSSFDSGGKLLNLPQPKLVCQIIREIFELRRELKRRFV